MKQIGNQRDLNLASKISPEMLFQVNHGSAFNMRCSDYITHVDKSDELFYKIYLKSGHCISLPKSKQHDLYPYRCLECIVYMSDGSILGTAELMKSMYQRTLMSID